MSEAETGSETETGAKQKQVAKQKHERSRNRSVPHGLALGTTRPQKATAFWGLVVRVKGLEPP